MTLEILKQKRFSNLLKILVFVLVIYFLFKGIALLVILMAFSIGLSYIINSLKIRTIGIELVTFVGVISAVKYGYKIAFIITFILIAYHLVAGGFLGPYVLWVIPAYCLGSVLAGFFPTIDISLLGLFVSVGINLNNIFFTGITSPEYLPKYLIYSTTNIIFNLIIFTFFGKLFLLLM